MFIWQMQGKRNQSNTQANRDLQFSKVLHTLFFSTYIFCPSPILLGFLIFYYTAEELDKV